MPVASSQKNDLSFWHPATGYWLLQCFVNISACAAAAHCQAFRIPSSSRPKRKQLSRLLQIDVPAFLPSPKESGFRSKVAFVFANGVMGHYALKSQRVIPIEECPVHHERGNRIAFALRDRLARGSRRLVLSSSRRR